MTKKKWIILGVIVMILILLLMVLGGPYIMELAHEAIESNQRDFPPYN